jgi:hypothetical protein
MGGWRKLHNELRDLYSSPIMRMKWVGHLAWMGEMRNANKLLVGKPEGKRPLGRARHRWVDNIKLGLREIGWTGLDWSGSG